MLKPTGLMESISSNLHIFLKKTGKNLSLADRKFLRDALIGLIRTGQPIVCKMARHLPNLWPRKWIILRHFAMAAQARNDLTRMSEIVGREA